MTYDSSNPAHVRQAIKQTKIDSNRIATVMAGAGGRSWVWEILSFCGVHRNPFSSDAETTAFMCGQLNVGQMLLSDIMAKCPELYVKMQKESEYGRARNDTSGNPGYGTDNDTYTGDASSDS